MSEPTGAFWDDLAEDMQDPEYANARIAALLEVLDGTEATALSVATGLTLDEIADLGGLAEGKG